MSMTYNVETAEHAWLNLAKEDLQGIKNPLKKPYAKTKRQSTSSYFVFNEKAEILSVDC